MGERDRVAVAAAILGLLLPVTYGVSSSHLTIRTGDKRGEISLVSPCAREEFLFTFARNAGLAHGGAPLVRR
ncbi:MAG: hypothetical protein ABFC80_04620 [Coriobacteriales bacterium]